MGISRGAKRISLLLLVLGCASLSVVAGKKYLGKGDLPSNLDIKAGKVDIWNLVGRCVAEDNLPEQWLQCSRITNPMISTAIAASCEATHLLWNPLGGCPNIGAFEAADADVDLSSGGVGANVVTSVMSTIGTPAVTVAYFGSNARFNMSINGTYNWKNGSHWLPDFWHNTSFDFKKAVDLKANAFATAVAFPSIIEFEDVKGDGLFDPETMKPVSTYNFSNFVHLLDNTPYFMPMSTHIRRGENGSAVYSMNATTYDNIFSIQFQSASAVQKNEDDVLIAPSTTKISVNIKDYPFKSNRSKLALEVLLLNANFGSEISPESDEQMVKIEGRGATGFFNWNASAVSGKEGEAISVKQSAWKKRSFSSAITRSIAHAVLFGEGGYDMRAAYFSFDETNPREIVWDPSLGVLEAGGGRNLMGATEIILVALAVLVAALAIAGVVVLRRKRQQRERRKEGYRALLSAYDLE